VVTHVILVDYPTSENIVIDFMKNQRRLPEGIALFSLNCKKTESSFCRVVCKVTTIIHYNLSHAISNNKIYFASDQHFGAPTPELSFQN
jgi:hypothetical protein